MPRPSWDEYFMTLAVITSSRATCNRAHVGAVLVKDRRVLCTGYNGSVEGQEHCCDVGCLQDEAGGPCKRTVHAEANAIAWAARHGISVRGCTLYVSHYTPCLSCAYLLAQIGCAEIVFRTIYHDQRSLDVLDAAGIAMRQFEGDLVEPGHVLEWRPTDGRIPE